MTLLLGRVSSRRFLKGNKNISNMTIIQIRHTMRLGEQNSPVCNHREL